MTYEELDHVPYGIYVCQNSIPPTFFAHLTFSNRTAEIPEPTIIVYKGLNNVSDWRYASPVIKIGSFKISNVPCRAKELLEQAESGIEKIISEFESNSK